MAELTDQKLYDDLLQLIVSACKPFMEAEDCPIDEPMVVGQPADIEAAIDALRRVIGYCALEVEALRREKQRLRQTLLRRELDDGPRGSDRKP